MSSGMHGFEAVAGAEGLWTREGDHDTHFACPSDVCTAANSSLARFCRSCGSEVDFEDAFERSILASGILGAVVPTGEPIKIDLARFGANQVLSMVRYRGLLLLGTYGGGLLVMNAAKPSGSTVRQVLAGQMVFGIHPSPSDDHRHVYLLTDSGLQVLSLIPRLDTEVVEGVQLTLPAKGQVASTCAFLGDRPLVVQPVEERKVTRLVLLRRDDEGKHHVAAETEIAGTASCPAELPDGRLLIQTQSAVHLCDENLEIVEIPVTDALDVHSPHARPIRLGQNVVLPAVSDVRLFDTRNQTVNPFGPDLKEPYTITASPDQRRLIALDQEGVKVIDASTGTLLGDSRTQLNFMMRKLDVVPIVGPSAVVMCALMPNGHTQVISVPLTPDGRVDSVAGLKPLHTVPFVATGLVASSAGLLVSEIAPGSCSLTRVVVGSRSV